MSDDLEAARYHANCIKYKGWHTNPGHDILPIVSHTKIHDKTFVSFSVLHTLEYHGFVFVQLIIIRVARQ